MRTLTIAVAGLFFVGGAPGDDTVARSKEQLQGTWTVVGFEEVGMRLSKSMREADLCERLGYTGDLPETPATHVTVKPFLAAQFYVTEAAWSRMGGEKLHWNFGPDHPADGVSREEASNWCAKAGLCLPDEKEWEYFCRAGTQSLFYWGDKPDASYAGPGMNQRDATATTTLRLSMPAPATPLASLTPWGT
jgi:formylglycine-generating enzyme required for sulfatase activity